MTPDLFLGFGGNLGDVRQHFGLALRALADSSHFSMSKVSSAYRTPALTKAGISHEIPNYWNIVAMFSSDLELDGVLSFVKGLESLCGRESTRERWTSRPLDIDLLAWGQNRLESENLSLPHPRCLERDFVLAPWAEIQPNFVIPAETNYSVKEHWARLQKSPGSLSPILEIDEAWMNVE